MRAPIFQDSTDQGTLYLPAMRGWNWCARQGETERGQAARYQFPGGRVTRAGKRRLVTAHARTIHWQRPAVRRYRDTIDTRPDQRYSVARGYMNTNIAAMP